jgi:capsule polysaccharide export protein KpsE/RkpR
VVSTTTENVAEKTRTKTPAAWVVRSTLLWGHRRQLARVTAVALAASLIVAFVIPKQYESSARIMPPDQQNSSALMLAALASRAGGLGGLGTLAGGLLSGHTTTALFVDLLRSGTITSHLIDRFHLQEVYHKRYRIDTAKRLARNTSVSDDKKSGVITITVQDTDPIRARDLTLGYLDGLNALVTQTTTSSAHRERIFIERRLHSVEQDLERAQLELSEFSSKNSTIDIKEQTRAMVEAAAKLQAEMLVEQSGLDSLRQIYGDDNIRVRGARARIASLQADLIKMSGSSAPLAPSSTSDTSGGSNLTADELYPPLRQLPRLAVPFADLYRRVRVQETVYELLTQQYEMARIEEAKDTPVVSVIDPPGIPEKKSFPPRLLLALMLTSLVFAGAAAVLLIRDSWGRVAADDQRKILANEVLANLRGTLQRRTRSPL